jgi:hypothetical protein
MQTGWNLRQGHREVAAAAEHARVGDRGHQTRRDDRTDPRDGHEALGGLVRLGGQLPASIAAMHASTPASSPRTNRRVAISLTAFHRVIDVSKPTADGFLANRVLLNPSRGKTTISAVGKRRARCLSDQPIPTLKSQSRGHFILRCPTRS